MTTDCAATVVMRDGMSALATAAIASEMRGGVSGGETMTAVMTAPMSDATSVVVSLARSHVMTAVMNGVAIDRTSDA